jgi:predicted alpha/beta-hydrolase family hydrolase
MTTHARPSTLETAHGVISLAFDGPPRAPALVALAHGAGAGYRGEFLTTVAAGLGDRGLEVCRFNFPYAERGRKTPDRQPVLEATWGSMLECLSDLAPGRLVVGGKSMGGRIASNVVATGASCDGLLFLGYPLHPPGRPEALRVDHLAAISAPMLFVAGTRDPLCPLGTLQATTRKMSGRAQIAVIEDGDHSFKVRRSSGRSTAEAWDEVARKAFGWIESLLE